METVSEELCGRPKGEQARVQCGCLLPWLALRHPFLRKAVLDDFEGDLEIRLACSLPSVGRWLRVWADTICAVGWRSRARLVPRCRGRGNPSTFSGLLPL